MKRKCAARANKLLNNKLNLQIYEKYCIFGKAYIMSNKTGLEKMTTFQLDQQIRSLVLLGSNILVNFIRSTVFAIS